MTYEINLKKNRLTYDISGIKQVATNSEERKRMILDIIEKNEDIQHTHILQIVDGLVKMPKKTAEKILNDLEKENIITSIKHGDSPNAKRTWKISPIALVPLKEIFKELESTLVENIEHSDNLKKILYMKKLSNTVKSDLIIMFLKLIQFQEWEIYRINQFHGSPKLNNLIQRYENIKSELAIASLNANEHMTIVDYVLKRLATEANNAMDEYAKITEKL